MLGQLQFLLAPLGTGLYKSVTKHISYWGSCIFFLARLCILSEAHDSGTTLNLKGFLFIFFPRLRISALITLLIICERNKACSQSRPVWPFSWSFSSHKNQKNATAAMQRLSALTCFSSKSVKCFQLVLFQEYPHLITKKRFCVP